MRIALRLLSLGVASLMAFGASAQSGIKVEVDDVTDNRVSAGMLVGSFDLRVKLDGNGLDKAAAARVIVKEAKDDRGTVLTKSADDPPDFMGREYNGGMLPVSMRPPARAASSVRVKGNVELYVPTRDPGANIKVDKALTKLDVPLSSKALKAAKIDITPMSSARYAAALKDRKLTEEKIAEIRAEGKKQGVPESEVELMIGLANALSEIDAPPKEGTVVLSGPKSSFDRIFRVEVLGPDGKPIDFPERGVTSLGDDTIMTLVPREPLPANVSLQLMLLTDKSKMSFPFDLNVELP